MGMLGTRLFSGCPWACWVHNRSLDVNGHAGYAIILVRGRAWACWMHDYSWGGPWHAGCLIILGGEHAQLGMLGCRDYSPGFNGMLVARLFSGGGGAWACLVGTIIADGSVASCIHDYSRGVHGHVGYTIIWMFMGMLGTRLFSEGNMGMLGCHDYSLGSMACWMHDYSQGVHGHAGYTIIPWGPWHAGYTIILRGSMDMLDTRLFSACPCVCWVHDYSWGGIWACWIVMVIPWGSMACWIHDYFQGGRGHAWFSRLLSAGVHGMLDAQFFSGEGSMGMLGTRLFPGREVVWACLIFTIILGESGIHEQLGMLDARLFSGRPVKIYDFFM